MYGMIKFQNWEAKKETKYSKINYFYKEKKVDEFEFESIINTYNLEQVKKLFENDKIEEGAFCESDIIESEASPPYILTDVEDGASI